MVLINNLDDDQSMVQQQSLKLNSGREIIFVAPPRVLAVREQQRSILKMRHYDHDDQSGDLWLGVTELCQTLDTAIEENRETGLFDGRSVLEIGFSTGLPAVYALASGASHVTIHNIDKSLMDFQVKPTLRSTIVKRHRIKFSSGDLTACKRAIGGRKFDVILAPELLQWTSEETVSCEQLHQLLNMALAPGGIVLFSAKPFYPRVTLSEFLEVIKVRGQFDAITRWTTKHPAIHPRKIIQLTRSVR